MLLWLLDHFERSFSDHTVALEQITLRISLSAIAAFAIVLILGPGVILLDNQTGLFCLYVDRLGLFEQVACGGPPTDRELKQLTRSGILQRVEQARESK